MYSFNFIAVFADLKTNCRRKARSVKEEVEGTGGGPSIIKPLNEIEERVLGLINKVVIYGAPTVAEPGVEVLQVVDLADVVVEEVLPVEVPAEPAPTPSRQARRRPRQRPYSAPGMKELIQSNNNIANALDRIANAIRFCYRR